MENVGTLLRHWRTHRRLSQLDLAQDAEVSTRHLSFLENGKAKPSREMVLVLASALEVPLRERNTLLRAAGFAPAYRQTDLDAPEMAPVRRALDFLLKKQEPYGAVVVDRTWNVLMGNAPFQALGQWLGVDPQATERNLLIQTFSEHGLKPHIENWDDVARSVLDRAHRESVDDPEAAELFERLASMPGVPADWRLADWGRAPDLLIPVVLQKDGLRLAFYTTVTRLGSPIDVTASELRIESYYPADDATEQAVGMLMGGTG